MPVFHPETAGDRAELYETEPFVQMACMDVALHNGVELEDTEAEFFCLLQAIRHQFFTDMLPAYGRRYSIACVAEMSAASHIVRVQDI